MTWSATGSDRVARTLMLSAEERHDQVPLPGVVIPHFASQLTCCGFFVAGALPRTFEQSPPGTREQQ
jgi:hypothetical protein